MAFLPRSKYARAPLAAFTLILGLAFALAAQQQPPQQPASPQPKPPAGGTYTGPGDTAPPPCTGPGCPQPPQPPSCPEPCIGDFLPDGCDFFCDKTQYPLPGINYINWTDVNGQQVAPACMQGPAQTARVYEIKIRDLLEACTANDQHENDSVADICMYNTCPYGIDAAFVYETYAFRRFDYGVPTTSGSTLPICGLGYDLKVVHNDGSCEDIGAYQGYLENTTLLHKHCDTTIHHIKLQFDCVCLAQLLSTYGSYGLYNPLSAAYLTLDSVAFVVLVKCCPSSGIPACDN